MEKQENKISLSQWIYLLVLLISMFVLMFMCLKVIDNIQKYNLFRPEFEFSYWGTYNESTCTFNSEKEYYKGICEELSLKLKEGREE